MRRFGFWLIFCAAAAGCEHPAPPPTTTSASTAEETADVDQAAKILAYAAGLLNGFADYDAVETNTRDLLELNDAARRALESGVPPSLVSQLNQWIVSQAPLSDWHRDALLDTLPGRLRKTPQLEELETMGFSPPDGLELRQAVWLRDASNWAAGETQNDLQRARRLFDWLVRNIQLDAEVDTETPRLSWQTLLLGHGTAIDRAWLFILMGRQQGLDIVMLANSPTEGESTVEPWLPALLLEGELYLFDPALGLPIPGPKGEGIATLSQVAGDDALLRHLDLDDGQPYGKTSADVQSMTALIEASPTYLAQRMALLESHLAGEQKVILSVDATALAGRLRECQHVSEVRLWTLPYERLIAQAKLGSKGKQRMAVDFEPFIIPFPRQLKKKIDFVPALWKGRVLHLLGKFTGEEGAMRYYQLARLPNADIERGPSLSPEAREELRGRITQEDWQLAVNRYTQLAPVAKHDASYWLGLIAFERENYKTAADFLAKRTIDVDANSPWRAGALYNLARAQEALDLTDDAVSLYRQIESPQRHGNLLRARWLAERKL